PCHLPDSQITAWGIKRGSCLITDSTQGKEVTNIAADMLGCDKIIRSNGRPKRSGPTTFILPAAVLQASGGRRRIEIRISRANKTKSAKSRADQGGETQP